MSRFLSLVLATLLAVFLVGTPASAAPRRPDPEVAHATARTAAPSPARVIPSTIDSDVYVYANSPSTRTYFLVAGRLRLTLRPGSMTAYKGNLVDYVGQKSYKASADTTDPSAPVVKLEGKAGKFTFTSTSQLGGTFWSGTATAKPKKLTIGVTEIGLFGVPHSTRSVSYSVVLSERVGPFNDPFEYTGTLTMVYDGNYRISGGQISVTNRKGKVVTRSLTRSGYFGGNTFYTVAEVDKKDVGLTGAVTSTSFSGYGFTTDGAKTTQWLFSGNA